MAIATPFVEPILFLTLLFNGYQGFFPQGLSKQGMNLTTHLHLVLRLRMSEGIPLLLIYAFMACTATSVPLSLPFTSSPIDRT
jgi:hypothetical protein